MSVQKKNEQVTLPGFVFLSTGGTEQLVNPVLDPYGPMISTMQKTQAESQNPVIKTELQFNVEFVKVLMN